MDTNRLPKQALQYKPKGRRNVGRPRKRWRDQLHLEDQGTGNTPEPSWTWWWWWWWYIYMCTAYLLTLQQVSICYPNILIIYYTNKSSYISPSRLVIWSQWSRGLRRRNAVTRFLRLWVRIPLKSMDISHVIIVFCTGRGFIDRPIPRPGESYRVCRRHWVWTDATITL